jgi:hypothetical protein
MTTAAQPPEPRYEIDYLDLLDRIEKGQPHTEYLTRRQTAEFLTAAGFPISEATLTRFCMNKRPGDYQGPPTACYWGCRALHRPEDSLAWARARKRSPPPRKPDDRPAATAGAAHV